MELKNYNARSPALRSEYAEWYELSILAGVDSFAYIIRDRARNQLLAYHSAGGNPQVPRAEVDEPIITQITSQPLLTDVPFGKVSLGWQTERFTLVPQELYQATHRRSYLEQLTLLALTDVVHEDYYNDLEAHLLFASNTDAFQQVTERLRATKVQHGAGVLLQVWAARSRRTGEAAVSACFRGRRMIVAAHRAGTLQFYNTFEYTTAQDALYYVLLAYDQAGMLPSRARLYLSGEVLSSGEVYQLLYTYVQDVEFNRYGAPPSSAPELEEIPPHVYFDLLCLG